MKKYFGTDGIRGVWGKDLTSKLCFKIGYVLGEISKNKRIVVGNDTRPSKKNAVKNFVNGVLSAGSNCYGVGIAPTPAISFLGKNLNYDYAVMITASHNPSIYNGIKIFNSNGFKLNDDEENEIENLLETTNFKPKKIKGKFSKQELDPYINNLLKSQNKNLKGLTIVLDTCFGASSKIAPKIFKNLGAKTICLNCKNCGKKINENCGATQPQMMSNAVKKFKADVGFAYDGDADRVIACDEKGTIIDGDKMLFLISNYFKNKNLFEEKNTVVGTVLTNMNIENLLKQNGINLIRTDVGDKHITKKLWEEDLKLGAEQCGHIIFKNYGTSGDGILSSLFISKILLEEKKPLSTLTKLKLFPQVSNNIITNNKEKIMSNLKLKSEIDKIKKEFKTNGRVIVRPSGTEPLIRIMVEHTNKLVAQKSLYKISKLIDKINSTL